MSIGIDVAVKRTLAENKLDEKPLFPEEFKLFTE